MNTIKRRKAQLSVAAVAALAIFAVAAVVLLAGGFTTGSAQAQGSGGDDDPAPQLCGPGQDHFPEDPEEVASSGHYALFDAYWQPAPGLGDDTKTGTLNDNLCPPAATHTDTTDSSGQTTEVTTRSPSKIDVRHTIIQVTDTHKADVVATNAEAGTTKLSLEKYEEVGKALGLGEGDPVPAGTKVYWLRLEDPALKLPPSDLVLGFSTGLLDGAHWAHLDKDGNELGKPFQYELESVRVLGANPADLPHVLTYWEPEMRVDGKSVVVWDGLNTDVNSMPMGAGEYEHLEWVFTKPGTYILQVHLKGHVRQEEPDDWDAVLNGPWKALTGDETVTSEVKRFVFQVDDLHINDQPHFGAVRSVATGAAADSTVGDVIPVFGMDADPVEFDLDGVGHGDFIVKKERSPWSHAAARLHVAPGANLRFGGADPDNQLAAYYDLHLKVSDKRAYENYDDEDIDDIVPVRIHVLPVPNQPWMSLTMSDEHPRVGEKLTIHGHLNGWRSHWRLGSVTLYEGVGDQKRQLQQKETWGGEAFDWFDVTRGEAGTQRYSVVLNYTNINSGVTERIGSGWYPVTWRK